MSDEAPVLAAAAGNDDVVITVIFPKAIAEIDKFTLTVGPIDLFTFEPCKIAC
jgi:hypothetical protein